MFPARCLVASQPKGWLAWLVHTSLAEATVVGAGQKDSAVPQGRASVARVWAAVCAELAVVKDNAEHETQEASMQRAGILSDEKVVAVLVFLVFAAGGSSACLVQEIPN